MLVVLTLRRGIFSMKSNPAALRRNPADLRINPAEKIEFHSNSTRLEEKIAKYANPALSKNVALCQPSPRKTVYNDVNHVWKVNSQILREKDPEKPQICVLPTLF